MNGASDPERAHMLERRATFWRLVDAQYVGELDVERWIASWDRWAAAQGFDHLHPAYWDAGWLWITEQWTGRRLPPGSWLPET